MNFLKLIYLIILPLNNKISMLQKDKATKIKSLIPSFNICFPPFAAITSMQRFFIDPIRLLIVWWSISDQEFIIAPVKDTFESYCLPWPWTCWVTIPQRFSMGLRSGLYAGQSIRTTFLSLKKAFDCLDTLIGLLSYWKIAQFPAIRKKSSKKCSVSMSVYWFKSMLPFTRINLNISLDQNAPHVISEPPSTLAISKNLFFFPLVVPIAMEPIGTI